MCIYVCFDVLKAKVAKFQSVSVKDFVAFMFFGKCFLISCKKKLPIFALTVLF